MRPDVACVPDEERRGAADAALLRRRDVVLDVAGEVLVVEVAHELLDVEADVIRTLEGPLAEVHGLRPDQRSYDGPAEHLQDVWVALRASMRGVLETVTLDQVVRGKLPARVAKLVSDPDAWAPRPLRGQ